MKTTGEREQQAGRLKVAETGRSPGLPAAPLLEGKRRFAVGYPATVLQLQRLAGNRAVSVLLAGNGLGVQRMGMSESSRRPGSLTPSGALSVQRADFDTWKQGTDQDVDQSRGIRGLPGLKTDDGTPPKPGDPDKYRFSIRVHVKDPNYIWNSYVFGLRKYTRRWLRQYTPTQLAKGLEAAAPSVFGGVFDVFTASAPGGMGHASVGLGSDKDGVPLNRFSFGFYPGHISNPDNHLAPSPGESPGQQRAALDVQVPARSFEAALRKAYEWKMEVEPPKGGSLSSFDLYAANCTDFALDVAGAAGVPISVTRIPAYNSAGFGMAATPNKLLEAIEGTGYSYDPNAEGPPEEAPTIRDVLWGELMTVLESIR